MKKIILIFSILSLFLFYSCGTIINGSNQSINVSSTPISASVVVDGVEVGQTPMTVKLARDNNHTLKLELDGYEPKVIMVTRKTSGWFIGNCLFGGLIGMGIDALSGGMYKLEPEEVNSELQKSVETSSGGDLILIKVVMTPNANWKKIGQLKKM